MPSAPMSVFPLSVSASFAGAPGAARRKFVPTLPAAALEILSAALEAEDQAMTPQPGRAGNRRAEVSGFGDEPVNAKRAPARAKVVSGRSTLSPATAIIQAHRQRRTGLEETVFALYYGNLSLFRAEETARELWGEGLNGAVISTCAADVAARIDAWLKRPLTARYDFVFLDTIVIPQRLKDGARETALHYAVGVDSSGVRAVLGVNGGDAADGSVRRTFLRDLRRRGLKDVRLFVGGMDEQLVRDVAAEFPAVRLQVCVTQLEREVLALVPAAELHAASQACAALRLSPDTGISGDKIRQMMDRLDRTNLVEASALLGRMLPHAFSYRPFPRSQWSQISSPDAVRRAVKPMRERVRQIGPVEDTRALVLLAAAHLRHVSRTVWGQRRFLRPKSRGKGGE